jgi:hypothetical protein
VEVDNNMVVRGNSMVGVDTVDMDMGRYIDTDMVGDKNIAEDIGYSPN